MGKIVQGDAVEVMKTIPDNTFDLIFADPPFNIGFSYDAYDDKLPEDQYLDWTSTWICEAWRTLKPTGSLWLAMCDEYVAECKVIATAHGEGPISKKQLQMFHLANWVIWYYTFGVCCQRKFSRSHTHLLHFTKTKKAAVYPDQVRIPSARQTTYNDKRATSTGKTPDNTWIINPAQAPKSFQEFEDTWHVPRVAGTFHARANITTTQMPEQVLGRIIRYCTQPDDFVFDPFAGSGSTLVTAKKLGRRYGGVELSPEYARAANGRITMAKAGAALD